MTAGDGIGNLQNDGPLHSAGAIVENAGNPALATLTANVFFNVTVSGFGLNLHNAVPLQIQSSIDRAPPTLNNSQAVAVPLLNDQNETTALALTSVTISGGPGPANALVIEGGNSQTGAVGQALAAPFVVRARDKYNNSIPGVPVTFAVTAGNGTLSDANVTTNLQGRASTTLTLGPTIGPNTATATSGSLTAVTFTATGAAPQPAIILLISGNNQVSTNGQQLPLPLTVKVTDISNNPVSGVPVVFRVTSGGGKLTGGVTQVTANTNAQGQASVHLTVGSGQNTVTASSAGLIGSPITFAATGVAVPAGPAALISLFGGNNQIGLPGEMLAEPFTVQVTDSNHIPVSGYTVNFQVTGGGGILSVFQAATNSGGLAAATMTLGPDAGTNTAIATAEGLSGSPVTFTATAAFTSAAKTLSLVSGNNQTHTVGRPLPQPFVVKATDEFNRTVSGANVSFRVTGGGGTFAGGGNQVTVRTDEQGEAAVTLTLGDTPGLAGINWVSATAGNLIGSPVVFTATGHLPIATKLSRLSRQNQTGVVGRALSEPLVVKVTDVDGIAVSGILVTFATATGDGSISPLQVATDSAGLASAMLTLGPMPGLNTVIVTAGELAGSPITFRATGVLATQLATKLSPVRGDGQTGVVGRALPQPLVVRATDSRTMAVPGVPVTFAIVGGSGILLARSSTTDDDGQAATTLILDLATGITTVTATFDGLQGSPVTFTATAVGLTTPILPPDSVVNGASFLPPPRPGSAVAPGSIVAVFGTNLASGNAVSNHLPLPTVLLDTTVTFNGTPAPLLAVSDGQIVAQIPFEIPPGEISVHVTRGENSSEVQSLAVASVSPGIFAMNSQGSGQGSVLISNTAIIAAPAGSVPGRMSRPVQAGEYISIYCTGLGYVTNPPPVGSAAPDASSVTIETPAVTIGGIATPATFSGLTGFAGLYQVDVPVPVAAPKGDAVDVVLQIAGVSSNRVTIAVQ
jgi:uncharacterized protein (TIGR03437 family)